MRQQIIYPRKKKKMKLNAAQLKGAVGDANN